MISNKSVRTRAMSAFRGSVCFPVIGLALAASAMPAFAQDGVEPQGEDGYASDPIVVTGSRIARSGFDAPTPVTVVGADQIGRQAASNVAQVLNDIPAFRPQSTPSTSAIFMSNIGANTADLRGLGANRTLVLIEGRRVVPATVSGGSFTPAGAVDLNLVPTSLLQRVDVVTGGASAAYGSDAVAGVVNLMLNTRLEGIRASAQFGITDEGDGEEYALSLAGGTSFAGGAGRIIAGVDYVNDKGTGDCYSRDWCALSYNTITTPFLPGSPPPRRAAGEAATIIAPTVRAAVASVNGMIVNPLGPPIAALLASGLPGTEFNPDGTTFRHDFGTFYGSGIFQSGGGDDKLAFYENFPISSPSERINAFAHAEFDASDGVTVFAEGSYGKVTASTVGAQRRDLAGITIRRDNAFLPAAIGQKMDDFGLASVPFGRIWNDIGPQYGEVERETYRLVGGLKAELGGSWTLDAYYQYGRTNYSQVGHNTTITPRMTFALDAVMDGGKPVCRAVLLGNPDAAGCQPLNPFGAGSPSAAAIAYVTGTATQDTRMTQHVASLSVQGDLFDLWAGPVKMATGVEYRKDKAEGDADPISRALQFYTSPGAPISGNVDVWEGFAEVVVPLADKAELNGAIRLTDYSTSGSVTTWKIGASAEPVDWLRLRATRSRDIRAPNIFELFGPTQTSFQSILDPVTGGQVLASVLLGGNAGLKPEVADTWTAGIVLQPDLGAGTLRLSVDYFDIKLKGAVSTLGAQVIVTGCNDGTTEWCDFVSRDPGSNTITQVRNFNLNLDTLITRGWDVEAYYGLPVGANGGEVSLRVLGTIIDDLATNGIDRAGMNGSPVSQPSGMPRYTINGYLTYSGTPFQAQLQVRHISGGRYNTTLIGPDEAGYDPVLTNSVSDNHVGAWTYVNLNASYDFWRDGDRKFQVFGVVNNLFDKDPPVDIPSSFGPTNNVLYDVVGRRSRIGVRFEY